MIVATPAPPYYAVVFTSRRTEVEAGYAVTAEQMLALAAAQPGYLGVESAYSVRVARVERDYQFTAAPAADSP